MYKVTERHEVGKDLRNGKSLFLPHIWLSARAFKAKAVSQAEFPRALTPSEPAEAQALHGNGGGSHCSSSTALRAGNVAPPATTPARGVIASTKMGWETPPSQRDYAPSSSFRHIDQRLHL